MKLRYVSSLEDEFLNLYFSLQVSDSERESARQSSAEKSPIADRTKVDYRKRNQSTCELNMPLMADMDPL